MAQKKAQAHWLRKNTARKISSRRLRGALIIASAAGALASGAFAQIGVGVNSAPLSFRTDYLGYAASISPRVTFTDNINLLPSPDKDDEVILSTLFTGSGIISSKRFTGVINGNLGVSYLIDDDDFRLNQDVGAVGTFTVLDNWLYFDVAGRSSRQLIGDNARFSANVDAARSQQADVNSFSLSPYLYHNFADESAVQARYRFSKVFIGDEDSDFGPGIGNLLNDTESHEALLSYNSGRQLDRFQYTISLYGNDTNEDGSDVIPSFNYRQGSVFAEGQYALSTRFSLSGAVGYDEVDTEATQTFFIGGTPFEFEVPVFDDDELSGFFWRAGFIARPGRRTDLRLEYGRRFDDDFINASLSYDITRKLRLTAGAARTFQTRAQSNTTRFQALQRNVLDFASQLRQGDELSPEGIIALANQVSNGRLDAQSVGIGASNNAFIALAGTYDRTTFTLNTDYQTTDFGFRDIESLGVRLAVRRDLSRSLNAYGDVFYRRSDTAVNADDCAGAPFLFGVSGMANSAEAIASCAAFAAANGVTNTVGGRVGASYRLYRNLSLFGEYSHTQRFSPIPLLEYTENTVTAGVTLDF